LATAGTISANIYQSRIESHGFACLEPTPLELDELVTPAIGHMKAGRIPEAREPLMKAIAHLESRGASRIILGCTEIPLVLASASDARFVDPTQALANACVTWWRESQRSAGAHPMLPLEPVEGALHDHMSGG
jgi:aspartate racemase